MVTGATIKSGPKKYWSLMPTVLISLGNSHQSGRIVGTPYLLTGISLFGGSSRMQASLLLKSSAGNRKIAHKWAVANGGVNQPEAPIETITFDEPVKLEQGVQYSFSGIISHDAGVQGQYQYFVGNETIIVDPGTLMWFNNKIPHGTVNLGDETRITFVFDVPHGNS